MRTVELRVDVSTEIQLPGLQSVQLAATACLPKTDLLSVPPIVLFALPGGGYSRKYFDLQFRRYGAYSQAEHHVRHGILLIAFDHLGTGDSTLPEPDQLTIETLAMAYDAAVRKTVAMLEEGTLAEDFPSIVGLRKVGIGQSMGGCITIVTQGLHSTFDAIIPLGYSAIHTVPPLKDPIARQALIESTGRLNRQTDVNTLSIPAQASAHTRDQMSYPHHWEDVPPEIIAADTAPGYPFCRSGAWPPVWRSATLPRCTLIMMSPGCVTAEAGRISVPVLIATGERDVCPDPYKECIAFPSSRDVSLFVVPKMAHMHNFASTREILWNRIESWSKLVCGPG
jgi:pimeloyl-ACP methyl ester carboxylesterase